jgi:pyrimidine deaminase RibD-like protein
MRASDFHIRNHDKLDHFLYKLTKELIFAKKENAEFYGWVAAGVLDPRNRFIWGINEPTTDGDRIHAEAVAMKKYEETYGDIPEGSIILTTLSPCNEYMNDRDGPSCTDLINDSVVRKVYCGFIDPSQEQDTKRFALQETKNKKIQEICKGFAEQFLGNLGEGAVPMVNYGIGASPGKLVRVGKNGQVPHAKLHVNVNKATAKKLGIPHPVEENFADGKGPGRPGDSQRHGIPKGATIAQLEKASHSKGRKGQLARWQLNMRRGRKK